MHKINFRFPLGAKAKDTVTGFSGTIIARMQQINGSIQYALQPPMRKNTNFVPDALNTDEQSITLPDAEGAQQAEKAVEFKFSTGDRVRNRVNGFEGIVTHCIQYQNGCVAYRCEAPRFENKENTNRGWEQELELIDEGLNKKTEKPVERKRTGGPSSRETYTTKVL